MNSLIRFGILLLIFIGLSLIVPSLFKHVPFLVLPLLGILAVLFMRQSLLSPLDVHASADPAKE